MLQKSFPDLLPWQRPLVAVILLLLSGNCMLLYLNSIKYMESYQSPASRSKTAARDTFPQFAVTFDGVFDSEHVKNFSCFRTSDRRFPLPCHGVSIPTPSRRTNVFAILT